MKIRVGLIGLGHYWESRHRPALRSLSDRFEIRAVYDQVAHRAEAAARDLNATPVDGFRALLAREDIDAGMLLAGQWFGAAPVYAACDAGKDLYCGAPLDLDPEQARKMRRCIEESGITFTAEFPRRQSPATLRLKELIATRLGQPRLLFCHMRLPVSDPKETSRGQPAAKQRSSRQDLVELIDWCSYVVGKAPTSVMGLTHQGYDGNGDDYQMMNLDFSPQGAVGTGATAQISCGRYMPDSWPEAVTFRPPAALQVQCESGIAFIDLPSTLVWFDKAGRHQEVLDQERPVGEMLLSQFYRSVTSLVRNFSGLEDAFRAVEVGFAARESHGRGQRLRLDPHGVPVL